SLLSAPRSLLTAPAHSSIYTLSLHERSSDLTQGHRRFLAIDIGEPEHGIGRGVLQLELAADLAVQFQAVGMHGDVLAHQSGGGEDRKSTRLNSSHVKSSYAVFCLKKKRECVL